ncbi:MAG: ABC transporter substrate-binding protein [Deltaproteobacteria bacterium]|nr:ABC transporter substrate-binding protein [Deltaproteobacteria bacterium]
MGKDQKLLWATITKWLALVKCLTLAKWLAFIKWLTLNQKTTLALKTFVTPSLSGLVWLTKIRALSRLAVSLTLVALFFGCESAEPKKEAAVDSAAKAALATKSSEKGLIRNAEGLVVLRASISPDPTTPVTFLIGDDLGFFQKRGLKLDIVGNIPVTQLVAAIMSGQLDVSHGAHINRTIAGISAGAKILAVVGNTETTPIYPHMVGVVRKDSPIRQAADIIGQKIGLSNPGGCHEYTPYAWLEKHGIKDPKNKIQTVIIARSLLEQALRQGDIDMAMLHKTPAEIANNGEFDVIYSDYDVWEGDGGATPNYFGTQFIKDHPDVVRNFVAAVAETLNWMNENLDGARAITAKRTNQDISKITSNYYTPDGLMKPVTAELWIELLTRFGEIKPGITVPQVFTNEFNPYYTGQF